MRPRLITIPISHYCERARWALDACGIDYDEDQHLQGFAGRRTRREGARHTVPVLVLPDAVLNDSTDIVRWASARHDDALYPATVDRHEIEALEAKYAEDYGVETRRIAYDWFFRHLELCLPYNQGAAPALEAWLLRLLKGLVVPRMVRYLRLSPQRIERGRTLVGRVMDEVAQRLGDGRPYLCGDTFTAADLTFASMTAPSLLPPTYGMPVPDPATLDDEARRWIESNREHPAGQFALRLYERRPPPTGHLARPLRVAPQGQPPVAAPSAS